MTFHSYSIAISPQCSWHAMCMLTPSSWWGPTHTLLVSFHDYLVWSLWPLPKKKHPLWKRSFAYAGGSLPEILTFLPYFFVFFSSSGMYAKIKWLKSEEKMGFGGRLAFGLKSSLRCQCEPGLPTFKNVPTSYAYEYDSHILAKHSRLSVMRIKEERLVVGCRRKHCAPLTHSCCAVIDMNH